MMFLNLATAIPIFIILLILVGYEIADFCREWRDTQWEE